MNAPEEAVREADALALALLAERQHPLAENVLPKEMRRARRAAAGQFPIDEEVVRFPAVAGRILAHFREDSVADAAPMPSELPVPRLDGEPLGPLFVKLSPREIEILDLVARGNSNKIIGRKLSISDQTVKNHVSAILRKLEVNDRTEAVVYALRNGWIRMEAAAS